MKSLVWLINISLLCTGFTYIMDEFILAQVGTNILGNSTHQWPLVITMMLVTSAVAYATAKYIPNRHMVTAFLSFEILLSLIGGFAPLTIMCSFSYFGTHFLLVFYGTAMAIGFFHGFQPMLIGYLNETLQVNLKKNFATVMSLDALGVAIGGFLYHEYIIGQIPLYHGSFFATVVNLFSATVVFLILKRLKQQGKLEGINVPTWPGIAIILSALLSFWGWSQASNIVFTAEQQLFTGEIIHVEDTRYQHIVLTEHPDTGDGMMFLNTGLQFCTADEGRYHENLVHPAMALQSLASTRKDPIDVLILGGGDGFAVRELKKYSTVRSITLVDLDPGVVHLAQTHPKMLEWNDSALLDARVHVFNPDLPIPTEQQDLYMNLPEIDSNRVNKEMYVATVDILQADAYKFVEEVVKKGKKYDVIIIDFPDPRSEAVGKLYSNYFFKRVSQVLNDKGIVAIQASSPVHSNKSFLCIGKSMQAGGLDVLPYQDNIPSFQQWGWYIGSKNTDRLPLKTLTHTLATFNDFAVPTTYLTPGKFFANTFFGKDLMKDWDEVEVNTILNPVIYHYYTKYGWQIK